ncbi:MAG: hypothetical protein ACP5RH_06120 [Leptodesmis sp.]
MPNGSTNNIPDKQFLLYQISADSRIWQLLLGDSRLKRSDRGVLRSLH